MEVEKFVNILDVNFYTGVPDSQLKPLCDYLIYKFGISDKHIIAANEGNCTGLAAGYYLSTGNIPVVYMQNSGLGNIVNPVASLLDDKVYAIPCIFVVGWRGEPGVHDEPQHIFQGEITEKLLKDLGIFTCVLTKESSEEEVKRNMDMFKKLLKKGKRVAFLVKKDALAFSRKVKYENSNKILREDIIKHIVKFTKEEPIVSTTGKTSRELYEIREHNGQNHKYDFLTVGSMGHSSSIALGIAMNKPNQKIWCIDGDGAALMHLGAMAVLGSRRQSNLVHIVINNCSHETVGGMPTVVSEIDLPMIAKGCGYVQVESISNMDELDSVLYRARESNELFFIEVKAAIGAREDLGRPTISLLENKKNFMEHLNSLSI